MTIILIILAIVLIVPLLGLLAFGVFGAIIALIIGLFMLIIAGVIKLFIMPWFENRDRMRLDTDHKLIMPDRQEVRYDGYNGYYVIDCYHTDPETGREFVFSSAPFANDPTPLLGGVKLGIFVNPIDYSNYYVDTSKLGEEPKDII